LKGRKQEGGESRNLAIAKNPAFSRHKGERAVDRGERNDGKEIDRGKKAWLGNKM